MWESFVHNPTTKRIFKDDTYENFRDYDDIFFASPGMPDEIVKEISKTAIKQNRKR